MSLVLNMILNIVLFYVFGMAGPAIASLISILLMEVIQISYSCKLLDCRLRDIINLKRILIVLLEILIVGYLTRLICLHLISYSLIRLFVCALVGVSILFFINIKKIMGLVKDINSI